eukprot:9477770-Pyramimonas_sp.AAC.1
MSEDPFLRGDPLLCSHANMAAEMLQMGESVKALRRFNDLLENITEDVWETRMWKVWNEFAHNLETFNPVFTACLLKVQCTIGQSDYVRRDECLRNLIQPLAGTTTRSSLGLDTAIKPFIRPFTTREFDSPPHFSQTLRRKRRS